jgi:hypothetical protein
MITLHPDMQVPCSNAEPCAAGNTCETVVEGYYVVATACLVIGCIIMVFVTIPRTKVQCTQHPYGLYHITPMACLTSPLHM